MNMSDFAVQIRTSKDPAPLMRALRALCTVDLNDVVRQSPDPQWIIWNSGESAAPQAA